MIVSTGLAAYFFVLAFEATVTLLLAFQMLDVIVRLLYLHRLGIGSRAHRDY